MTNAINSPLAALISKAYTSSTQVTQPQPALSTDAAASESDSFGAAVNLSLSPAAQTALASQSANTLNTSLQNTGTASAAASSSTTTATTASNTSSAAAPPAPGGSGGGGGPVASTSTSTSVEELIEEEKQQLIPQVGVTGASEVIDSQGNIDEVKLNQLLAAQRQPAQQPQQTQSQTSQIFKLVA